MSRDQADKYHFFPLGDSGLLIDFGNSIEKKVNERVLSFFGILQRAQVSWILDLVPAYSSLAVFYDVQQFPSKEGMTIYEQAAKLLQSYLCIESCSSKIKPTKHHIPVCYERGFAPDLEEVAKQCGLSTEEVIEMHISTTYRVYMIGFLPGFAYMGEVPDKIAVGRRSEPRSDVPKGSVGIAGKQTGIYPFDSPGGWQLIGRTPVTLFQKAAAEPTRFKPGDEVLFYPISKHEFTSYKGGVV